MKDRTRKRIKRTLAVLGVVVLVTPFLAVGTLQTSAFKGWLRTTIVDLAEAELDATLEIERIDGSVLGSLTLHNVELKGLDDTPLIRLEEARASYSILGAIRGTLVVDALSLDGLEAFLINAEDGLTLTQILPPDDGTESAPTNFVIDLRTVEVNDASVYFADRTRGAELVTSADAVDLSQVNLENADSIGAQAVLENLTLTASSRIDLNGPLEATLLALDARLAVAHALDAPLSMRGLDVEIGADSKVAATVGELTAGTYVSLNQIRVDFDPTHEVPRVGLHLATLELTPELNEILDRVGSEIQLLEKVDLEILARGTTRDVNTRITLESESSGEVQLSADLTSIDTPESLAYEVHGRTRNLSAQNLIGGIEIPEHRANLHIQATGKGIDPETASLDLRLGLENTTIDAYFVRSLYLEASARDSDLTIDLLYVDTPYAQANAHGSFNLRSNAYSIRAALEGQDDLNTLTGGALGQGTLLDANLEASGRLDLDADEPLLIPIESSVSARWDVKDFVAEKIRIDSSRGRVDLEITSPAADTRRVAFDIDVTSSTARAHEYRLSSLRAKTTGAVSLTPPIDRIEDIFDGSNLVVDANVSGLRIPGIATLARARVNARLNARHARSYTYQLDLNVEQLTMPDLLLISSLETDLRGRIGFDNANKPNRIASRGTVTIEKFEGFSQAVEKAKLDVDIEGPTRALRGNARLEAEAVKSSPYDFESLVAKLELLEERKFKIDLEGRQPEDRVPRDLNMEVAGSYSPALDSFEIDDVRLKTFGESWIISNGLVAQTADGTYRFRNLKLRHGGEQEVTLDGTFRVGVDQDLNLKLHKFSVGEIVREFGLSDAAVDGQVDGTVSLTGTSQSPQAEFDLIFEDFYYEGQGPFRLHVQGYYDDTRLYLTRIHVTTFETPALEGTAIIPMNLDLQKGVELLQDEDYSLIATLIAFQIQEFREILPQIQTYQANATVRGEIALFGRPSKPNLDVTLNLDGLVATLDTDGAEDVAVGPVDLESTVRYAPVDDPEPGLHLALALADQNGDGFRAQGGAELPVDRWLTAITQGDFDQIQPSDWMEAPFELLVLMPSYDLSKVNVSAARDAKMEGTVDLYVQADGTVANPSGTARGKLSDFGWERFRDIYVDLDMDFGDSTLNLNRFHVNWDEDDIFTAKASLPVPIDEILRGELLEDVPLEANLQLFELPIAKLSAFDYTFASVQGRMAGEFDLKGRLTAPRIRGALTLNDVEFSDRRKGDFAVNFNAQNSRLTANATLSHEGTKSVSLSGAAPVNLNVVSLNQGDPVTLPGPLSGSLIANDVQIASLIPRRLLQDFIRDVGGRLNADLSIAGTYEQPRLSGEFIVKSFKAFMPTLGRTIDDGKLHVAARDGNLDIVELHAEEGRGYLDADGTIEFQNLRPQKARLKLAMSDMNTSGFSPVPAYVTGNADLDADLAAEVIDASIVLRDLDIAVPNTDQAGAHPLELSPDIEILTARENRQGALDFADVEAVEGERNQVAKVQIRIEPNSWVRHPNAELQFRGDLALDVGRNDTIILGDVSTVSGKLEFLGKEFSMQQGIVTFAGNTPPNPRLQVEAAYALDRSITDAVGPASSGQPRAIVRVTGTARKPLLRLSSDPQMTESQIIYVLVSDRPPNTGQGGEEEGVAGQAVAAASGLLSGMLRQRAAKYTPIDTFRLTTDSGNISGVEVGRYFGKNLFFAYQYEFAAEPGENISEFRLEYTLDFAPSWLVGTRVGDQGNGAVFVFWDAL